MILIREKQYSFVCGVCVHVCARACTLKWYALTNASCPVYIFGSPYLLKCFIAGLYRLHRVRVSQIISVSVFYLCYDVSQSKLLFHLSYNDQPTAILCGSWIGCLVHVSGLGFESPSPYYNGQDLHSRSETSSLGMLSTGSLVLKTASLMASGLIYIFQLQS